MSSSSGVLTDLTNAIVKSSVKSMIGLIVTRPALKVGSGTSKQYVCDVNVGLGETSANFNQTTKDLLGVPGTSGFNVNDTLTTGTILRNVPVASNNQNLRYADVGNAVKIERTSTGTWSVTGFSVQLPGTRIRYPIDLTTGTIGSAVDSSVTARPLTLGELSTLGPGFGYTPFGASGVFVAGVLQEINA
jgi:hypothetical protein